MAVTLSLLAGAGWQFFDNNGIPLAGGLLYTYQAGTNTPIATYTDVNGNIQNSNPIILNSSGRPPSEIWLTTGYGYKFVLKDANNVLIGTYDNIPSSAQPAISNDASSIAYEEGNVTNAGSFIVGQTYLITYVGTTDFTTIGAATNTVGTHFIATGVGTGSGTAELSRTVQSKLQEFISTGDFGSLQLAVVALGSTSKTLYVTTNDTISTNLTIPSNISLIYEEGYITTINNGVTLTINGDVQAGYYQIFNVGSTGLIKGLRIVHFEWFGAVGNAISPTIPVLGQNQSTFNPVTGIPTGTDDTSAIQTTMRIAYAQEMLSNYQDPTVYPVEYPAPNNGPGSQPWWGGVQMAGYQTVIKGRPGAAYLCSGSNILGPQTVVNQKIFFDGQGCSFEWLPQNTYDYFIDALDLIERPVYKNFNLRTWGYTGSKGVFCHAGKASTTPYANTNRKEYGNLLLGPMFYNVVVDRGGYYYIEDGSASGYPSNNALQIVFFIEGFNQNALWDIGHCTFVGFANFWISSNPEAVGVNIHDCEIESAFPNCTFVLLQGSFSGGYWLNNCEIGMWNTGQTFFQTYTTSATAVSGGPLVVRDCRMETRTDDFTLFNLMFGNLEVTNLQPQAGNTTNSANAKSVVVSGYTEKVLIKNSWMPQILQTTAYTATQWAAIGGNGGPIFDITFDGCTFPYGTPTPLYKDTSGTSYEIASVYRSFLITRSIKNINCNNGYDWAQGGQTQNPSHVPVFKLALSSYSGTDGNTYVNINSAFPIGSLITSILVVSNSANLSLTNRIVVSFPNSGPVLYASLSATTATVAELIPSTNKGICVLTGTSSYNGIVGGYYLNSSPSSTLVPATVIITYRPILGLDEMGATNVTALV